MALDIFDNLAFFPSMNHHPHSLKQPCMLLQVLPWDAIV